MTRLINPIDVYSDSQGAIAMTYNPVHRSTTKHSRLLTTTCASSRRRA